MKKGRVLAVMLVVALMASLVALAACAQQPKSDSSSAASKTEQVTVPNVVSFKYTDAEIALNAAGLVMGDVSYEPSDTIPGGGIISQDPKPMTQVESGTKVSIVMSSGKKLLKNVSVPDLTGMTQADAEKALEEVGLVGVAANPEQHDGVTPGTVFEQGTAPGTEVKEGTPISFTTALAVSNVTVPDLSGKTKDEAKDALVKAGLGFDTTVAYDDKVAEGKVVSQSIPANTSVKAGTNIIVTISLGAKPQGDVKVPNVITFTWSDAEAALKSAGLNPRYTGDVTGVVVAQDIASNTSVAPGTTVTVTMAVPKPQVEVPDFKGMTISNADAVATGLGLDIDAAGSGSIVIDQWPSAGSVINQGTTVHVTLGNN